MKKVTKSTLTNKRSSSKKGPTKKLSLSASSHIIPKSKGSEMTQKFGAVTNYNTVFFSKGLEFDKSIFEKLLKLRGVKKIRIYNAVNEAGQHTFVITGVDAKQNDIYFKNKVTKTGKADSVKKIAVAETESVANMGNQCPAYLDGIITL